MDFWPVHKTFTENNPTKPKSNFLTTEALTNHESLHKGTQFVTDDCSQNSNNQLLLC